MHLTEADATLLNTLPQRVAEMKRYILQGEPYVWKLRLSLSEFLTLEKAIGHSLSSHGNSHEHLLSEEFAVIVVIYLAEWYKRFYNGADTMDDNKVITLSTEELKKLYQLARIDANTFVYNASTNPDKTSYRWLESLQVLGGLAVQAELKRDQNDALLPQLCKIFHGEEIELDDLKDRNRAVAFQESIARKHSLYEYLDCILSKEKEAPFAKDDINNEETCIPQLLSRILEADEVAKKNKFDFEWVIAYTASRNQMVRHLRVKLKPEEIGGGKKQYIGYDRLMKPEWGLEHPEDVGRIRFYLRFKDGGRYVRKMDKTEEPLFKYDNTGSEKTGFLSVNRINENTYTNVPVCHFDKVEMVMKYDQTQEDGKNITTIRVVQEQEVADYMQVYALPKTSNKFSTRKNAQAATAVIFSSAYHLAEPYRELSVVYAHYRNGEDCGEDYCWCPINDKVILVGPDGKEISPPFFNRNGLYQVVTKKYLKTIKYKDNVFVLYKYIDTDYDDEEMQEDYLPVLFGGRSGLDVLRFPTRDSKEGEPVTDYDLEWLKGARYVDWNEEEPEQGAIRLRVTVKGIVFKPHVYYVPFTPASAGQPPIWRDFEHMRICTALDGVNDIQDHFEKLLDVREPGTKQLKIGNDQAQILVDVYRPILLRELSQRKTTDDRSKVVDYYGPKDDIEIPLINCEQFSVRDFSENGVREYQLKRRATAYYHFPTYNDTGMVGTSYQNKVVASELDPEVPLDHLMVYLTKAFDDAQDLYAWNYRSDPEAVSASYALKEEGIVFQSLKDNDSPRHYAMPIIKNNDDEDWGDDDWGDDDDNDDDGQEIDVLRCYETVAEHKTYFFLFAPLLKTIANRTQVKDILLPLMRKRQWQLTDNDVENLYRFAMQFHFDWMLLPREMWQQQIAEAADSEEEREAMAHAVTDFFRKTPKATDERERTSLADFVKRYWTFDNYPEIEKVAQTALNLIMDKPDALLKVGDMRDFLKIYDEYAFKFIEMSKAIVSVTDKK